MGGKTSVLHLQLNPLAIITREEELSVAKYTTDIFQFKALHKMLGITFFFLSNIF